MILKETYKVMQYIHFSSCSRSQYAWGENAGLGQHTFLANTFLLVTF